MTDDKPQFGGAVFYRGKPRGAARQLGRSHKASAVGSTPTPATTRCPRCKNLMPGRVCPICSDARQFDTATKLLNASTKTRRIDGEYRWQ